MKGFFIREFGLLRNGIISPFTVGMALSGMITGGVISAHRLKSEGVNDSTYILTGMSFGCFLGMVWPVSIIVYPTYKILELYSKHH